MIFKCKNCGGNTVYNPTKMKMVCPHCESEESQSIVAEENMTQCVNCGAPMEPGEFTAAMKCPNCGNYHVFEQRISGEYQPHLVIPFKISKEEAEKILKKAFGKKVFTPSTFLSHASIAKMEGSYVPFFLYDYDADASLSATGTKVRSWSSGSYRYTETSYYRVEREMDIDFNKIPVDASVSMDNSIMDLLEPYDYNALQEFEEKYMSGFQGEVFSENGDSLEKRASDKARSDSKTLLRDSVQGYSSLTQEDYRINLTEKARKYALLPVWVYDFQYQGKTYQFHVNGESGKVIGEAPVNKQKVVGYGATVLGMTAVIGFLARAIFMFIGL